MWLGGSRQFGRFQSRTGSTGHLARAPQQLHRLPISVSITNGRTSPFFHQLQYLPFATFYLFIPTNLHRPFFRRVPVTSAYSYFFVSIPNGLPRPFSRIPPHIFPYASLCFNPERAPQAI